jgi:hypothetical protein
MTEEEKEIINDVIMYAQREGLTKKSRLRENVYRRHYLYAYLRSKDFTFVEIGKAFDRHHATVFFGLNKYELFKSDSLFIHLTRHERRLFNMTNRKKKMVDFGVTKLDTEELEKLDKFMFEKEIENYSGSIKELLKLLE